MYNICIEAPAVDWSSVPGHRTCGYDQDKLEDAQRFHDLIVPQVAALELANWFVVICQNDKDLTRTKISLDNAKGI